MLCLHGVLTLLCGNGYIVGINQIYDVGIDKINKPFLPIAAGDLSIPVAWGLVVGLAALGIGITSTNFGPLITVLYSFFAFDPKDRPTAEEALADAYFKGLAKVEQEPSAQPITKMEFEFERRCINKDDVRELIYREILEYHPQMLKEYLNGTQDANFMYPRFEPSSFTDYWVFTWDSTNGVGSAVDQFKQQFAHLEENYGKNGNNAYNAPTLKRQHASLPRPCLLYTNSVAPEQVAPCSGREHVMEFREEASKYPHDNEKQLLDRGIVFGIASLAKGPIHTSQKVSHMLEQLS